MESKRDAFSLIIKRNNASNRTSMESKRPIGYQKGISSGLLIEPVWNRNTVLGIKKADIAVLLIEPVWNRNDTEHPPTD